MGIVATTQGTIWFAEEAANYIGRFVPGTCQFTTYPLPARGGSDAAPNGVALAPDGKVWFTQFATTRLARLIRPRAPSKNTRCPFLIKISRRRPMASLSITAAWSGSPS